VGSVLTSVQPSTVVDTTSAVLTVNPSTFSLSDLWTGYYPQIVFEVSNTGQQTANNVDFQFPSIPDLSFDVGTKVGDISPGETVAIIVDVATSIGNYNKRYISK
jgi:hypothetical protein